MLRRRSSDGRRRLERVRANEHHLALILSLVIGALVALVIAAFMLLTGRLAIGPNRRRARVRAGPASRAQPRADQGADSSGRLGGARRLVQHADSGVLLALCEAVLALDPTRRGLTARERDVRSVLRLERVRERAHNCVATAADAQPIAPHDGRADAALREEMAEATVDRPATLWQQWTAQSGPPAGAADEPLRLVLTRTARSCAGGQRRFLR
jgi:hypothetical protein